MEFLSSAELRTHHVNLLNCCPVHLASRADFDAFRARYVTLFELADERGIHHLAPKVVLEVKSAWPALDKEACGQRSTGVVSRPCSRGSKSIGNPASLGKSRRGA